MMKNWVMREVMSRFEECKVKCFGVGGDLRN